MEPGLTGGCMDNIITSIHNQRVKDAARLRDHRGRVKQQRIIIDGAREVSRALAAGIEIVEAYAPADAPSAVDHTLVELRAAGVAITRVAPDVFEKLAFGDRTEGMVAVALPPRRTLADFLPTPQRPIVVLEGIEKPGNVGAVVRSGDGAGIGGVILADCHTELFNPNAIRASLGAIFQMPIAEARTPQTLDWLREREYRILAARVDGSMSYADADLTGTVAIVLGSEAQGLTPSWSGPDVANIKLPMLGIGDSVNVSAAAAVLCYEALRQRGAKDA